MEANVMQFNNAAKLNDTLPRQYSTTSSKKPLVTDSKASSLIRQYSGASARRQPSQESYPSYSGPPLFGTYAQYSHETYSQSAVHNYKDVVVTTNDAPLMLTGTHDSYMALKGGWCNLTRREVLLICLCVFLGFLSIALAVPLFYVGQSSRCAGNRGDKGVTSGDICFSYSCLKSAAETKKAMDLTAEPCADFYQYACGGWHADTSIPPTAARWNRLDILNLGVKEELKNLLEDPADRLNTSSYEWKIKRFFESCIEAADSGPIDACGSGVAAQDPLSKLTATIHAAANAIVSIEIVHFEFNLQSIFHLDVKPSIIEPNSVMLVLDSFHSEKLIPGLNFRNCTKQLNDTFISYAAELYRLVYPNKKQKALTQFAKGVLHKMCYFSKLSSKCISQADRHDTAKLQITTVGELRRKIPSIGVGKFIGKFLYRNSTSAPDNMTVAVCCLEYFATIEREKDIALSSTELDAFLTFQVLHTYAQYASTAIAHWVNMFRIKFTGELHIPDVWERCVDFSQSPALGALFLARMRNPPNIDFLKQRIFDPMKNELILRINESSMDEGVKSRSIRKLVAMKTIVSHPEGLYQTNVLDKLYEEWDVGNDSSFLESVTKKAKFDVAQMRIALLQEKDNGLDISAAIPIANYHYQHNTIVIPAALLRWPYYQANTTMPDYLYFATIAPVVASEMLRALDLHGDDFNEHGVVSNYSEPFLQTVITDCLLREFRAVEYVLTEVSQIAPLNTAFRTAFGLRLSYKTMLDYYDMTTEGLLPGLGFTPRQLFFITYVQSSCGIERDIYVEVNKREGYIPTRKRVQLALRQVTQFSEVFGCKARSIYQTNRTCDVA